MLNTWPANTKPLMWGTSLVTERVGITAPDGPQMAWPFDPSWPPSGRSVEVTHGFLTEIVSTRSGKEFRSARRSIPRKQIRQTTLLWGDKLRLYKDVMWGWQNRDFVMPDPQKRVELPAEMPQGTDTIVMDDPPDWLLPGVSVVIGLAAGRDTLIVGGVAGNTTFFTSGVTRTWPAGAPVNLGLVGNLALQVNADRQTNEVASADVTFSVRPLSEPAHQPQPPSRTFDGREVFLGRANWAERVTSALGHEVDILDYDTGPISRYSALAFGREITGAVYLGRDVEEVSALTDLFYRMHGQRGEFWMPTWEPDLVLRGSAGSGTTSIRVKGRQVVDHHTGSSTHKAIFVYLADGSVLLRTVSSIGIVSDGLGQDSVLNVGDAWPMALTEENVIVAGWLLLRRFASDRLVVEWLTSSVANVRFNLMTLEALPPDGA